MIEIAVACVAAISAISVALIEKSRRQNSREHGAVIEKINSVEGHINDRMDRTDESIVRLAEKVDGHIGWHLGSEPPRKTSSQKRSRSKMAG